MKIECNQCGAAYSVADAKVAGRKLKLRCKRCSEPIRVDGTALPLEGEAAVAEADVPMASMAPVEPEPAPAPAGEPMPMPAPDAFEPPVMSEPDDGACWHISVGDTTQGPYTLDEIAEYYAQGSIVLDTLVYRDGWDDWVPAGEVAEIAQLVEADRVGAQSLQGGGAIAMGADPFGDPPSGSPRVSAEDIVSGESRVEGTVQFSLDEIRAISAVSLPAAAPSRPGFASGEGSGLIDFGALAAMSSAEEEHRDDRTDSLIGVQASPLDSLAPMALPMGEQDGGALRTKLFAGVAALGLVLTAGVTVLALTYRGEQPPPQVVAAAAVAPAEAAAEEPMPQPAAALAAEGAAAEAEEPAEAAGAAEAAEADAAEEADTTEASEATAAAAKPSKKAAGKRTKKSAAKARARRAPTRKSKADDRSKSIALDDVIDDSKKRKSSGGSSSIDDLLDGAISGKSKPAAEPKPEPKSDLPKAPSRDDMLKAFGKAKSKVKGCKGDGVATASITIGGNGKVKKVSVSGVSGPAKSCVEKAVRSTRFPQFSKPSFDVKFPFKL